MMSYDEKERREIRNKVVWATIQHWHRMTDWVSRFFITDKSTTLAKQYGRGLRSRFTFGEVWHYMNIELNEDFYADYCPLCRSYFIVSEHMCSTNCPIIELTNIACAESRDSMWNKVRYSKSPEEWVQHSNELLDVLYSTIPYDITTA